MEPLTLSVEGQINLRLAALDCSVLAFSKLVQGVLGRSKLVLALNDSSQPFPGSVADRLLERVGEMENLQKAVSPLPINWAKSELVANALLLRLTAAAARDLGLNEPELQQQATWATAKVAESEAGGGE